MQLYILNHKYETIGVIDDAESVLWNKKYNDVGECEIYIPCSENYLDFLKRGNYVFRYDDDMLCKIVSVEIETDIENGDYIIATGKDICNILSGRIVRWNISYSGKLPNFIKLLLDDNAIKPAQTQRKIPNLIMDESNFNVLTKKVNRTAFTDDLLHLIITTCNRHNYGFRMSLDIESRQLVFRLYEGKNKASTTSEEYVEFSPTFANILTSNYKEDESNYKNVVYVGYINTAGETHLLSLYKGDTEPTGESRREVYVDGTGTSRDITLSDLKRMFPTVTKTTSKTAEGEVTATYYIVENGEKINVATSEGEGENEKITVTDYTYLLFIHELGETTLKEYNETQEFSGDVDTLETYVYKTHYELGDIVKVINDYGIEAEARITEIMESDDNENGHVIEPKFEYLT